MHLFQFHLHILAHLQVQGRQRLIQQQHLRLIHDGAGDRHTLLLATGKGIDIPILIVCQPYHFQRLFHFLLDRGGRKFLQLQAKGDIIVHIQMWK